MKEIKKYICMDHNIIDFLKNGLFSLLLLIVISGSAQSLAQDNIPEHLRDNLKDIKLKPLLKACQYEGQVNCSSTTINIITKRVDFIICANDGSNCETSLGQQAKPSLKMIALSDIDDCKYAPCLQRTNPLITPEGEALLGELILSKRVMLMPYSCTETICLNPVNDDVSKYDEVLNKDRKRITLAEKLKTETNIELGFLTIALSKLKNDAQDKELRASRLLDVANVSGIFKDKAWASQAKEEADETRKKAVTFRNEKVIPKREEKRLAGKELLSIRKQHEWNSNIINKRNSGDQFIIHCFSEENCDVRGLYKKYFLKKGSPAIVGKR